MVNVGQDGWPLRFVIQPGRIGPGPRYELGFGQARSSGYNYALTGYPVILCRRKLFHDQGTISKRPWSRGDPWTIPVEACAIVGLTPRSAATERVPFAHDPPAYRQRLRRPLRS